MPKYKHWIVLTIVVSTLFSLNTLASNKKSDEEIREILIKNSARDYSGACPCPYTKMSSGRKCGKISL